MKVYYILSILSEQDKKLFFETLDSIKKIEDIDELIKTKYYRVNKPLKWKTMNSIILETWIFIKSIWERYWVNPNDINWVYKQNMIILNDDLWLFENDNWEKISTQENIYFFTSRYNFQNIFWSLWEELLKINKNFPKIIFPNKNLETMKQEKTRYILNVYRKRKEIIWNFMLPLMYTRNISSIKNMLNLWKKEVWTEDILIKKSWWTDNGKHISLIKINEYVNDDQKLEYLFYKYISKISERDTWVYFTDFYDIHKEYRLYYSLDKDTWKYNFYSAKQKINVTQKEDLYCKTNLSTWNNLKVKWNILEKKDVEDDLQEYAKYILKRNQIEVWVIEFVQLPTLEYRFLEINCLGGSMMFEWKDEDDLKNHINNWWNYLFNINNI